MAIFVVLIFIDFLKYRRIKRLLIEAMILSLVVLILHLTTGFPESIKTFGSFNPESTILLMLVSVVLGMTANYFFHLKKGFNWLTFIKPLFISPIVLLPLIGTVNETALQPVQLFSLMFIAFQNGFFWKEVYNKAQKSI